MTSYNNFIGIDIGKEEFVMNIHGHKQTCAYENTTEGLEELYGMHKEVLDSGLVVLEVTGGYEMPVITYLQSKGVSVHRANGRQVKHFIRSHGIIAKNDNIDAIALARYSHERFASLKLFVRNKHDLLREHQERRSDLVRMRASEKNRLKAPNSNMRGSIATVIEVLNLEIIRIEEEMNLIVSQDPELQMKAEILKSIPGIGDVTSIDLISNLPEIGTMNQKQVASLAGVAPHPNQSGKHFGIQTYERWKKADCICALHMLHVYNEEQE